MKQQDSTTIACIELGALLRATRVAAGRKTRQIEGWTSPHVSNVETGKQMPGEDFVQYYIDVLGGDRRLLVAAYAKADRERRARRKAKSVRVPPPSGSESLLLHDICDGIVVEEQHSRCILGEHDKLDAVLTKLKLRSIAPDAQHFRFTRPLMPGAKSLRGGAWNARRVHHDLAINTYELIFPLSPNDPPRFVMIILEDIEGGPSLPVLGYVADSHLKVHDLEIVFPRRTMTVWPFRLDSQIESSDVQLLPQTEPIKKPFVFPYSRITYRYLFNDLRPGEHYGLQWSPIEQRKSLRSRLPF